MQERTHEELMKTAGIYREMFERQEGWYQAQGEVRREGE